MSIAGLIVFIFLLIFVPEIFLGAFVLALWAIGAAIVAAAGYGIYLMFVVPGAWVWGVVILVFVAFAIVLAASERCWRKLKVSNKKAAAFSKFFSDIEKKPALALPLKAALFVSIYAIPMLYMYYLGLM